MKRLGHGSSLILIGTDHENALSLLIPLCPPVAALYDERDRHPTA